MQKSSQIRSGCTDDGNTGRLPPPIKTRHYSFTTAHRSKRTLSDIHANVLKCCCLQQFSLIGSDNSCKPLHALIGITGVFLKLPSLLLSSVSLSPSDLSYLAAAQPSCQLSVRDLSTTSNAMDTAVLTLDPESCPYCAKAMANESEGGTEGNDTPGDSDSEGVYEFSHDLQHRDRRDSRQPTKKHLRLGKTAANIVRFWRLVCDTFRKIVDSKYFGRGIMIAILINTLSMGIEFHEQVS